MLDTEPLLIYALHPLTNEPVDLTVDGGVFLQIVYVSTFIG